MLKVSLVAAFLAAMAFTPAFAQDLCNDAHMKQMDDMIAKMTDAAKKKEATMHLDMSKRFVRFIHVFHATRRVALFHLGRWACKEDHPDGPLQWIGLRTSLLGSFLLSCCDRATAPSATWCYTDHRGVAA